MTLDEYINGMDDGALFSANDVLTHVAPGPPTYDPRTTLWELDSRDDVLDVIAVYCKDCNAALHVTSNVDDIRSLTCVYCESCKCLKNADNILVGRSLMKSY